MSGLDTQMNRLLRRLRRLLAKPPGTQLLLAEAFVALAIGRIGKALPFARIAPLLGEVRKERLTDEPAWAEQTDHDARTVARIGKALHLASRYTPWESQCMVMAIAALLMLRLRGKATRLYLGVGKHQGGSLRAHAWLCCGPHVVTGADEIENYTVVCCIVSRRSNAAQARRSVHDL